MKYHALQAERARARESAAAADAAARQAPTSSSAGATALDMNAAPTRVGGAKSASPGAAGDVDMDDTAAAGDAAAADAHAPPAAAGGEAEAPLVGDDEELKPSSPLHHSDAEDMVDYDESDPSEVGTVFAPTCEEELDLFSPVSPASPDSRKRKQAASGDGAAAARMPSAAGPPAAVPCAVVAVAATTSAAPPGYQEVSNSTDELEEIDRVRHLVAQAPERYPWELHAGQLAQLSGHRVPRYPLGLFDTRTIPTSAHVANNVPLAFQKQHYIRLFLQHRFYEGRTKKPRRGSEADALTQAWNAFVTNYTANPAVWEARLEAARERHLQRSVTGKRVRVHQLSRAARVPCCIPDNMECPCCFPGAPRMSQGAIDEWDGPWARLIPDELRSAHADLLNCIEERGLQRSRTAPSTTSAYTRSRAPGQARPPGESRVPPRYHLPDDTQASEHGSTVFAPHYRRHDPHDRGYGQRSSASPPLGLPAAAEAAEGVVGRLAAVEGRLARAEARCIELEADASSRQRELLDALSVLRSEHAKLLADHRRLLQVLDKFGVPDVVRKRRAEDMGEGGPRKK